jgi:hypothetical protein
LSRIRPIRLTLAGVEETIASFPVEVRETDGRLRFTLALTIIRHFFSESWCEKNILQDAALSRPPGFLRVDFTPGFEGERRMARILDFAEMLFNLQHIDGYDERVDQMRTGDIESAIAEFDFARFLYLHDIAFRFVVPVGEKGKDFDFAMHYRDGREACADAKCRLEATEVRGETIIGPLNTARKNNLPADKPGIIFVKVPQRWLQNEAVRSAMRQAIDGFLRNTGRVVSVVVYTVASSKLEDRDMVLMRHSFLEYANPSHRFDMTKRWTLFKDYEVPREWGGMHPKWQRILSHGFLFGENRRT